MDDYETIQQQLAISPCTWLVTGAAGFIGSHLVERLLLLDQQVVGLDNFATGRRENLAEVRDIVGSGKWGNFRFVDRDIRSLDDCREACRGVDRVLHQAALGSVPRSIADPIATSDTNISGFLNMLVAARDAGVRAFVYASSSSVYGDHAALPKVENVIGEPLSPYALTKLVNEQYAKVFSRTYGFHSIGLRYFNVFGPRQDPNGAYAAVIPKWAAALIANEPVSIHGDGESSRDFCFVANAVQANLLAAMTTSDEALDNVYNVAVGDRTTLNALFATMREVLGVHVPDVRKAMPLFAAFRAGDVRHSMASIAKAERHLGYRPSHTVQDGLRIAMAWYASQAEADALPL